jgi:DtxR family Mn-dependent transcriptional regulator
MDQGITSAMEDYLRTIYLLSRAGSEVRSRQIARALGVTAPSATAMIQRLQQRQLVVHHPYGAVVLSRSGESVAADLLSRRILIERFLVEHIGLSTDAAHSEAEQLEHVVSVDLESRIRLLVERPMQKSGSVTPSP